MMFSSDGSDHPHEHLVLLTSTGDRLAAQILAARLASEGVFSHLRGEAFGPYPLTVGSMAEIEIWVPEPLAEEARLILQDVRLHEASVEIEPAGMRVSSNPLTSLLWWLVAASLLAWIVWLRVVRFL